MIIMRTDNYTNYHYSEPNHESIFPNEQETHQSLNTTSYEEELLLNYNDYLDNSLNASSYSTKPDDFEEDDEDLEEDDLDDDLTEDYDENDREPDTFSDDGYKVD